MGRRWLFGPGMVVGLALGLGWASRACTFDDRGEGAARGTPDAGGAPGTGGAFTGPHGTGGAGGRIASGVDAAVRRGCSKVDLVIAVDASSSMGEELMALSSTVFPALAQRLIAVGGGLQDFRVGVLDACPTPASYHKRGASTADCTFSTGKPWMESTSPRLAEEFACVGDIYTKDATCTGDSDDEQPASAAAASLEHPFADGPNNGFSRPDALLVVMAITDEDEQPTPNRSAAEVHDRLIAAKGGRKDQVVFLGVGGASSCAGVYGSASHAAKLQQITDLFRADGRGVFWDLCQGRLEDGLSQAIATIDVACGNFKID